MDDTQNLKLPYILAAQAQKHVTHNEALRALDAIVHLAVLDRDLTTPPVSPSEGDRYIVAAGGAGDWSGKDDQIAAWQDGAWAFYSAKDGWLAWVGDEDALVVRDATTWTLASSGGSAGGTNPVPLVGVNATADTTNRLSVSSTASLFNHEGAGHQQKINKASAGDTASQLYQNNFSGRAEIGLTGDDDFHFKVSADGSNWTEAITIDKDTGVVAMPQTSFGAVPTTQVFSASGTWTKPSGLSKVKITILGGGGGGGGAAATAAGQSAAGGGGAAGAKSVKEIDAAALGATETVTIGAVGTGGAAGNTNGGNGGASSFGAHASAPGGGGGFGSNAGNNFSGRAGGASTAATGGDINAGGMAGLPGMRSLNVGFGGNGGSSSYGGGGRGLVTGGVGGSGNGNGHGAGGSGGAIGASQSAVAGGNGTAGLVIVEEYY